MEGTLLPGHLLTDLKVGSKKVEKDLLISNKLISTFFSPKDFNTSMMMMLTNNSLKSTFDDQQNVVVVEEEEEKEEGEIFTVFDRKILNVMFGFMCGVLLSQFIGVIIIVTCWLLSDNKVKSLAEAILLVIKKEAEIVHEDEDCLIRNNGTIYQMNNHTNMERRTKMGQNGNYSIPADDNGKNQIVPLMATLHSKGKIFKCVKNWPILYIKRKTKLISWLHDKIDSVGMFCFK